MEIIDRLFGGTGEDGDEPLPRGLGFETLLPVSWAVGGGILFGGFTVGFMTLAGRLSGAGLFVTAGGLFIMGSAFGFVHGAVLAYFGRTPETSRPDAIRAVGRSVLYSIPSLAIAWAVAGWMALTVLVRQDPGPLPVFGIGVGWLLGLLGLWIAVSYGRRGFVQALRRWPDRVAGTVLVGASFSALSAVLLISRPDLWWGGAAPGFPASVIFAGGITVWLVGPLVTVSLWLGRKLDRDPVAGVERSVGAAARGIGIGLVAGAVLGLLIQLAYGSYGVLPLALWGGGTGEALAVAAGQGLLDEVLLRLFVVTGLVWLLGRGREAVGTGTVVAAVVAAALLHVGLYLPSILEIGFPSLFSAVGYAAVALFVPSLVYGALFWRRGLLTAAAAHATTVAVAALLVA